MTLLAPAMPKPSPAGTDSAVEVCLVDPTAEPAWDRWVAGHPLAGPFHGSAWARVLVRTYGHQPLYVLLHRAGRPAALLPVMEVDSPLTGRRGVCLPFADLCAPLVFGRPDPRMMLDVLVRLGHERGWSHLEVRGAAGLPSEAPPSVSFFAHELDLSPGPERVWSGFDSSVRRAVRKAEREQVSVEVRTDGEAVSAFCQLHARSRRRHGLPPQPRRFFDAIREEMFDSGLGSVVLASREGAPVAAAVFLQAGPRAVYKFGASDERDQASRANNLAMWKGLQWLMSRGVTSLHFGRTSCSQEGLRRYKRGWGASESTLHYHKLALPSTTWVRDRDRAAGLHTRVFSHLPLSLNRLLGAALYPHLD